MKVKSWLAAAVAAALLGGALLVGVPSLKAFAAVDTAAGQAVKGVFQKGIGMHMDRGIGGMADLADFLGISQDDLIAARQSGKSLVQIAGDKGISEQQLVDYMTEKSNAKIDQKVTDGKITGEQAEQLKQSLADRIKANLNRTDTGKNFSGKGKMDFKDGAGMGTRMGCGMGDMDDIADFLGISREDLIAARQSGKSLVQIAGDKGISEQQLVDYMAQKCGERIDQQVADGKITGEQAEQLKQSLADRIKANLNRTDAGPARPDNDGRSSRGNKGFIKMEKAG